MRRDRAGYAPRMRLIRKLLRTTILAAVIAWFADPNHGAERRAKARDLATEAGRRARDGIRRFRAAGAARNDSDPWREPGPAASFSEPSARR